MHIVIDSRMVNASGIGTYLNNLIARIVTGNSSFKFTLLGESEKLYQHIPFHYKNVDTIDCRSPIYSISEQIELFRNIPKNTDLFWSPHYNIPLFYSRKLIVTIHDAFHLAMPQFVKGSHKRLYARGMFTALKHKADAVVCVSQFTADEVQRLIRIDPCKLRVIYDGVSESWFNVKKKERPYSNRYLLYVGNVKPHKNIVGLIEAFKFLIGKIPHDLIIVGKKEGFITGDKLGERKASELGDRINFTGYMDKDLLVQYYVHADALILPSFYEGFGLPPLEAMACGCPVIVSNVASLPEVCGNAVYYVDPYNVECMAEGIYKVLTDDALRQSLIDKGLKRARLFSWERSAREYLKVFEEVLSS